MSISWRTLVQKLGFGLWVRKLWKVKGLNIKIRTKLYGFYMVEGPACKLLKGQGLFRKIAGGGLCWPVCCCLTRWLGWIGPSDGARADGSGWRLRAAPGQRPAVALGGGARRRLAGALQDNAPMHETKWETNQNKEGDTRNSSSCLWRKDGCRRRRSMARAELRHGFLVRRIAVRGRAWVSGAGWRCSGTAFYWPRRGEEGYPRWWAAAHRRPPLRLGGASVGDRYGRERKRKGLGGAGWVRGALEDKGRRRGEGGEASGRRWPARPLGGARPVGGQGRPWQVGSHPSVRVWERERLEYAGGIWWAAGE
jgi:hypothetical protein